MDNRSNVAGHVLVDVGETNASFSSISTKGLIGCYGILIDGLYDKSPFCFVDHHTFSVDRKTTLSTASILISLIEDLVKNIRKSLKREPDSSEEIILKGTTSNLSLLVCGGVKQDPDHIRLAFQLLQHQLSHDVIDNFAPNSDELYLCQELNFRTTIISSVSYLLPDSIEDMAADK
ncbi:unnamed protein product, partial [Rotaria sordida]